MEPEIELKPEQLSFEVQLSPVLTGAPTLEEWDDTKLRHAYWPNGIVQKVAMCGYDGPSTWKGGIVVPPNVCPICLALLRDRGFTG